MSASPPLVVGSPRVDVTAEETRLAAPVALGERRATLDVRVPLGGRAPDRVGDALLLWFVLPAMRNASRLEIDAEVSPELLERSASAMEAWAHLAEFAGHRPVPIEASRRRPAGPPAVGPAARPPWTAAFSAGVDSFFTTLRHHDRIGFLTHLHGIDREVVDPAERVQASAWLCAAAATVDLPLVEVDTNHRRVVVGVLGNRWDHSFVMAPYGLAHLLHPHASGMLLGSELAYDEAQRVVPGTKYLPLLDPWVSSDAVAIRVDGMGHRRHEKLLLLREHRAILANLIVCGERARTGYAGGRNCGACEKCLRTMVGLRLVGAEVPEASFDAPLDVGAVRRVRVTENEVGGNRRVYWWALFAYAVETGADARLVEALRVVVSCFPADEPIALATRRRIAPDRRSGLGGRWFGRLRRPR